MKVLVTGSSGFVGRHLIGELTRAGHSVCTVDRTTGRSSDSPLRGVYLIDLCDRPKDQAMLAVEQPDAIVHLAGWAHVGKSWDDPAATMRANVEASTGLYADACSHLSGPCRFLFVSSAEIYGAVEPEELPITLETPVQPTSPYGLSKYTAEMALAMLRVRGNVELMVARPFNHIGPGQRTDFACPSFARKIVEIESGRRLALTHGNLAARRDFLDVRDVVRAYRLILEHGSDGDTFLVASGVSRSMEEVVLKLFEVARVAPAMEADPKLFRPVDIPELLGDPSYLHETTGWAPEITIEDSLADVLNDARAALARESL